MPCGKTVCHLENNCSELTKLGFCVHFLLTKFPLQNGNVTLILEKHPSSCPVQAVEVQFGKLVLKFAAIVNNLICSHELVKLTVQFVFRERGPPAPLRLLPAAPFLLQLLRLLTSGSTREVWRSCSQRCVRQRVNLLTDAAALKLRSFCLQAVCSLVIAVLHFLVDRQLLKFFAKERRALA